jgi:hypothetical protein
MILDKVQNAVAWGEGDDILVGHDDARQEKYEYQSSTGRQGKYFGFFTLRTSI